MKLVGMPLTACQSMQINLDVNLRITTEMLEPGNPNA